jgi:hypothetical protein
MARMTQPRVTHRSVDIDGYPTVCVRCGQPIVKKRHDSQQHHDHTTHTNTSWHTTCPPPPRTAAPSSSGSTPRPPGCTEAGASAA